MSWTDAIYEDGADRGVGAQRHTESMLALRERVIAMQGSSEWYLEDEKQGYSFGLNPFLEVPLKGHIKLTIESGDWVDISLADEFGSFDDYFTAQPEWTGIPILTPARVLEVAGLPADWFSHPDLNERYRYGARDSEYGWQSVPAILNQLIAIEGSLTWTGERRAGEASYEGGVLETPEEIRDAAIADYTGDTPTAYSNVELVFEAGWSSYGEYAFIRGDKGTVTVTNPSDDSDYDANHKGAVAATADIYRRRRVTATHTPDFGDGHGTGITQVNKYERWHTDISLLAGASADRLMDVLPPVFPAVTDPMPESYFETHKVRAVAIYKFDFDYKEEEP